MNAVPNPIVIPVEIAVNEMTVPVTVVSDMFIVPIEATVAYGGGASEFGGPYEYEPGEEAQIIEIADKVAKANITIDPIPSNYGRIAWNGVTLTVY